MRNLSTFTVTALLFGPLIAQGELITGSIEDWAESGPLQVIGDGTNNVTLFWSINTSNRGFFYGSGFTGDSDVAIAPGISDIAEITDAASFAYTSGFIGPVCDADCAGNGVGTFVVWNNINTGHFGALRIDDIVGSGLGATLNGTWWFQTDGSGDFQPPSDPATLLEQLGVNIAGVGPGKSFADKIALAQTYLAVPDVQATCAIMSDFLRQVNAQRGKKLSEESADQLIEDALNIMDAIGCN